MKRKTGISIMLALLIIVSAFAVVDAAQVGNKKITPDNLSEPIDVSKKVWNGTDWANEHIVKFGEVLRFNITITYNKHCQQGIMATDIIVIDELSTGLEYIGNANYLASWIIGNFIYWNLTEEYNINLTDGQSISIEFDALIVENNNVYVSNYVEVSAWEFGCSGCYLFGFDSVFIEVIRPIEVSKKVWDGAEWVEEINAEPDEIIRFNITITYNKNCQQGTIATNIVVIDELPEGLEFNGNSTYLDSYVEDNIVYWSLTLDHGIILTDGESVSLEFDAIVNDYGEFSNFAKVYALEVGCNDWTIYGDDQAIVYSSETKPIDVSKKVWDGTEWVEEINAEPDEIIRFNISITYNKNCQSGEMATDILLVDELSPGLNYIGNANYPESWINGNIIYWNLTEDHNINLTDGQSISIEFDTNISDYGEYYNYVDVLAWEIGCDGWYLYGNDYAIVIAEEPPPIIVQKQVYNPDTSEWVDELLGTVKKNDTIKFKISVTYNGFFNVNIMKDMVVEDLLPDCGLIYIGNEDYNFPNPKHFDYPDITVSEDLKHVIYDWTNKAFNLYAGECIEFVFDTKVVEYCYDTIENFADVDLWNWPYYLSGSDYATINCYPPESSFEKKVKDTETGEWVEETNTIIGETVRFRIELTYYGNNNLSNISVVDHLPCSLDYANNASPTESQVSEDLKEVLWNITEDLEDGETLEIQFDALAVDVTGCTSGINIATVTAFELEEPFTTSDVAEVSIDFNNPPSAPGIIGNTTGYVGEQLQYSVKTTDPDDDDVCYLVDWDDGSPSEWSPLLPSGSYLIIMKSWDTAGEYTVRAKAKDIYGKESDWSYFPLIVKIEDEPQPNVELDIKPTKKFLIGRACFDFINTGEVEVEYIEWEVHVHGGFLNLIDKGHPHTYQNTFLPGEKFIGCSGTTFGREAIKLRFGPIHIDVNATVYDDSSNENILFEIGKEYRGFVLGRLVIIRNEINPEE